MSRAFGVAAVIVALAGCRGERTEVFVVVSNGGVTVPDQVDTVVISGRNPQRPADGNVFQPQAVRLCTSTIVTNCSSLPLSLTLIPGPKHPSDRVRLSVQALRNEVVVQDDAVEFEFVNGTSARLDFTISSSCLQTTCATQNKVCTIDGHCTEIQPQPFEGEPLLDQGIATPGDLTAAHDLAPPESDLPPGPPCGALALDGTLAARMEDQTQTPLLDGPFTLEAWVHADKLPAVNAGIASRGDVWAVGLVTAGSEVRVHAYAKLGDSNTVDLEGPVLPINRWSHLAVTYGITPQPQLTIFLDGLPATSMDISTIASSLAPITVGGAYLVSANQALSGHLDEVRVSKFARYSAAFVPASRFSYDLDTYALYHFDERFGQTPHNEVNDTTGALQSGATPSSGVCAPRRCGVLTLGGGIATFPVALTSDSVTMEAWVNHDSWGTDATIIDLLSAVTAGQRALTLWAKGGAVGLTARCANGTATTSQPLTAIKLRPGIWSHVAVTFDSINKLARVFVDGEPSATQTVPCAPLASANSVWIGSGNSGTDQYSPYQGKLDDLRISNGLLYATAFVPSGFDLQPDSSTRGLYHFQDPSTTTATDSSSNQATGALAGGAIRTDSFCY